MAVQRVSLIALFSLFASGSAIKLAAQKGNACGCLNWKEVYAKKLTKKGDGLGHLNSEMHKFLSWLDAAYCVNIEKSHMVGGVENDPGLTKPAGTWCYVSSQCQDLGDGRIVNAEVGYKTCAEGSGESLGDLSPAELFKINDDARLLALMSYPWVDPARGMVSGTWEGAKPVEFTELPQKPVLTTSPYTVSFQVHYKNEVWNVRNGAICLEGCASPLARKGPLSEAVYLVDMMAIEQENKTLTKGIA